MHNNNTNENLADEIDEIEELKQDLQKRIIEKNLQIKQSTKELASLDKLQIEIVPNKPILMQEKHEEIAQLNKKLIELQTDLANLSKTKKDEQEENIQKALMLVDEYAKRNPTLAYIIEDEEFVIASDYSRVPEKLNVQMKKFKPGVFSEFMANELNVSSWNLPPPRVKDAFSKSKRSFTMSRYSIDPLRWDSDRVYLPIEHMQPYFINNMQLTADQTTSAEQSLQFFDWLMYSLSGNKQENKEHIEKWILHKIINYKKATTTPDIVIVGHVGGNGKGVLQAIIRLMLPSELSGKANSKTLNGNFNAIMLGKLIVFFDDQNSKEIPLDVVKELAGSDTMIFEPKGKDQYEGEKTHSSAWFSQVPPFKLTPAGQEGGVDRRFSLMGTNITFLESIRKHVQEQTGKEVTVEESKDLAEVIVSKHLLNRVNIAYWFKHLQSKYPEVNESYTLKALHGEDYRYFLSQQETTMESIFKRLINPQIKEGNVVPVFVIKELTQHFDGKEMTGKAINKEITALAAQHKLDIAINQVLITIHNPDGTRVKRQCSVVHSTKKCSKSFNWSLVSSSNYTIGPFSAIPEDSLIFRVNDYQEDADDLDTDTDTDTDSDSDTEYFDFEDIKPIDTKVDSNKVVKPVKPINQTSRNKILEFFDKIRTDN